MVSPDRSVDDLSEVVRRRLETLLDEIPPRRVHGEGDEFAAGPTASPRAMHSTHLDGHLTDDEGGPARAWSSTHSQASVEEEALPESRPPAVRKSEALAALVPRARRFVREHLIVVGIIVLTGVLWGGYSLLQARTTAVPAAAAQPGVEVSSASETPRASPAPQILVHVLGEVARPGVVKLPEGARVQDALAAAGGLTRRARPGDLNLAAPVADGAQLVIGRSGSQVRTVSGSGSGEATSATGKLDLNTATAEQLDALPGVGPVTAQNILAWRSAHGRFRTLAELQEVDGIGPKSYARIAPHVRV